MLKLLALLLCSSYSCTIRNESMYVRNLVLLSAIAISLSEFIISIISMCSLLYDLMCQLLALFSTNLQLSEDLK